ncbi:MAG TPA: HEAT repeat domain-containing protein [Chthoniobacteraceae bacterium]|nr:HEAT repeat domain-containing protein [Chthoniobacteraceae bacterium]
MKVKHGLSFLFLMSMAIGYPHHPLCAEDAGAMDRRIQALNADTLSSFPEFRDDPNPLVRRAAVRSLAKLGVPALDLLKSYARDDTDPLVRRTAVRAFVKMEKGEARVALLESVLRQDRDELVRVVAVEELAGIEPRTPQILALLREMQADSSHQVARSATNALWTFDAEATSARDRPEFRDTQLNASRINLPKKGWRFKTDPTQTGHVKNWTSIEFDDARWAPVEIERPWRDFGFKYEGVGWYRLTFKLPAAPERVATDLVFDGVDEAAWVWVNGEFLGAHDIGPAGYNKPFAADTRGVLKWGEENTIVVRASKPSGGHAGIWKPVYLEVLNK